MALTWCFFHSFLEAQIVLCYLLSSLLTLHKNFFYHHPPEQIPTNGREDWSLLLGEQTLTNGSEDGSLLLGVQTSIKGRNWSLKKFI